VLEVEARAILSLRERLGGPFLGALALLRGCTGQVVVTGMGKPGFIAAKLSATLASVGVRSVYLHPAEAVHGDLGRVAPGDVVLALSNSGTTEEVVRLLPSFRRLGVPVVALTGDVGSPLALGAAVVLDIGRIAEACPLGLVPTASTAALHALGDALVLTLMRERQVTTEAYARLHPGGKLGRSVMRVGELMRTGAALPRVEEGTPLSAVVVVMTNTPGRPGAAAVVGPGDVLVGIFTDGDLRRRVEKGLTDFSVPVGQVVGHRPRVAFPEELVLTAAERMRETGVDQLPVVDAEGRLVGLLDVQDLLSARLV
jgi:arabinose-5-phosphate isomerase